MPVSLSSVRQRLEGVKNWVRSVETQVAKGSNADLFWLETSARSLCGEAYDLFEEIKEGRK